MRSLSWKSGKEKLSELSFDGSCSSYHDAGNAILRPVFSDGQSPAKIVFWNDHKHIQSRISFNSKRKAGGQKHWKIPSPMALSFANNFLTLLGPHLSDVLGLSQTPTCHRWFCWEPSHIHLVNPHADALSSLVIFQAERNEVGAALWSHVRVVVVMGTSHPNPRPPTPISPNPDSGPLYPGGSAFTLTKRTCFSRKSLHQLLPRHSFVPWWGKGTDFQADGDMFSRSWQSAQVQYWKSCRPLFGKRQSQK